MLADDVFEFDSLIAQVKKKGRDIPGPAWVELAWRGSLINLRDFYFVKGHCFWTLFFWGG